MHNSLACYGILKGIIQFSSERYSHIPCKFKCVVLSWYVVFLKESSQSEEEYAKEKSSSHKKKRHKRSRSKSPESSASESGWYHWKLSKSNAIETVGSLSNHNDDENVKKNNWFYEQNNSTTRASRF